VSRGAKARTHVKVAQRARVLLAMVVQCVL